MTDEQYARERLAVLCVAHPPAFVNFALDAYRDAIVAATKAEYEAKLEMGVKWRVSDNEVYVEKRNQRDGTSRFVVIRGGLVLAKDGQWEWESQPSSRTDAFVERTGFDSLNAAIIASHTPSPEPQ